MENEKLLQQFLKAAKSEIPDAGFTEKVLKGLPDSELHWVVYLLGAIGFSLTIYIAYALNLFEVVLSALHTIPFYYILAAFVVFPFAVMFCLYKNRLHYNF